MAELLEVSLSGYQNYERDQRIIPRPVADAARQKVGLNPEWLYDGSGRMFEQRRPTVAAADFFTESEGTETDERLSESQPKDETARFAASRLANEALKQAGVDAGIGLRAVLRDLVLWYGVPEETLTEVVAAVKEEIDRAKRG